MTTTNFINADELLLMKILGNINYLFEPKVNSDYIKIVMNPFPIEENRKQEKLGVTKITESRKVKTMQPAPKKDKNQSKAILAVNARLVKFGIAIKNVIFAGERTIVFFKDGTKTTVQCRKGDTYSKEAGIAFAIVKKLLGKYDNGFTEIRGNGYDRLLTDIAEEAIKQEAIRKAVSEKAKALKGKAKEKNSEPTPPPKVAPEANGVSGATKAFANS